MNKYQETLNQLLDNIDYKDYSNQTQNKVNEALNELYDLVKKYPTLEQENFELRQKLNTVKECCARLEEKRIEQAEIIKSLAKALEDNEIDLSYLIFSYLTPDEYMYVKTISPNFRSDEDE